MSRTALVSFNGKDCSGCKHLNERGYCEFTACIIPCTVSAFIPEVKPQTNADRIRAMSDEELAEYLYVKTCEDGYPQFTSRNDWLEWLRQEAE